MNDLPLTAADAWAEPGRPNQPEYTVSELAAALKRSIEENFSIVRVRGEVSGFKRVSSGHLYFALKDADAVLDAVCWRTTAMRLTTQPEDGMEVIATGRLTTYPGRSKYQWPEPCRLNPLTSPRTRTSEKFSSTERLSAAASSETVYSGWFDRPAFGCSIKASAASGRWFIA